MSYIEGIVNVEDIDYPTSLGSGNEVSKEISKLKCGCEVIEQLVSEKRVKEKDLYFDEELIYKIISTVHEEQRFCLCQKSEFCSKMAQAMRTGEYVLRVDKEPIIIGPPVGNFGNPNKWMPCEGKHRVCIAKQFGIDKLPVRIDICSPE